jgi:hypothetical protein
MSCEKNNGRSSLTRKPGYLTYLSVAVFILSSFFLACTPGSCFEETNAYVKAIFYDTAVSITISHPPDSLTAFGIGADTTELYSKAKNVKPALLPLNPSTGNSSFLVRIDGINDTLTFNYSSYPHLISKECGYTFYHVIGDPVYTTHKIKYITVKNKNITTINEANINIYY